VMLDKILMFLFWLGAVVLFMYIAIRIVVILTRVVSLEYFRTKKYWSEKYKENSNGKQEDRCHQERKS